MCVGFKNGHCGKLVVGGAIASIVGELCESQCWRLSMAKQLAFVACYFGWCHSCKQCVCVDCYFGAR